MIEKNTKYIKVDPANFAGGDLAGAAEIIRTGGLVAFPTETVYGLGANALDPGAVRAIFRAKGRPADNPLIVHLAEISQVYDLAEDITVPAQRVMEAFWPGPLTLVLPKKSAVPLEVTAGLNTVAVRMPDHPVALELIRSAGVPVAAPSANSSGKPSPTTARHVLEDLDGKIDAIVDGGVCRVGLESTVLDMTSENPAILRPGGITREDIEGVIGYVAFDFGSGETDATEVPRSPGMKYTHYSPRAEVIVVTGDNYSKIFERVTQLLDEYRPEKKVGVLASSENVKGYAADGIFTLGSRGDLETVARNLFHGLRSLDEQRMDLIIAEGYPESGIGAAIMNRLNKASGHNVIYV